MTMQPLNMTISQLESREASFLILIFYLAFKHFVLSLYFNLQSYREFLSYKALKMTFGSGPLLLQKYNVLPKPRKKKQT